MKKILFLSFFVFMARCQSTKTDSDPNPNGSTNPGSPPSTEASKHVCEEVWCVAKNGGKGNNPQLESESKFIDCSVTTAPAGHWLTANDNQGHIWTYAGKTGSCSIIHKLGLDRPPPDMVSDPKTGLKNPFATDPE